MRDSSSYLSNPGTETRTGGIKNLAAISALVLVLVAPAVQSHVPYFEHIDWQEDWPFEVRGEIAQSIAVYSWIGYREGEPALDIDFYTFEIGEPADVYIEAIVPACVGYEEFEPWFAIIGPGLPTPSSLLPVEITVPDGEGAIVVPGPGQGAQREVFYEPFGGKSYFVGQRFREPLTEAGRYSIIFWDPMQLGGDYVAVIGDREIWGKSDIIRATIYTPLIRRDRELHIECVPFGDPL